MTAPEVIPAPVVESGIPVPLPKARGRDKPKLIDLKDKVAAACKTAELLMLHTKGAKRLTDEDVSDEQRALIYEMIKGYAEDPLKASQVASAPTLAKMRPASLIMVDTILQEFSERVVIDSVSIRNLVTNKLLLETDNKDAKIRLRALELLGKISDVGLFAEKHIVDVNHKTDQELHTSMRGKLNRILQAQDEAASGEAIDVVSEQ